MHAMFGRGLLLGCRTVTNYCIQPCAKKKSRLSDPTRLVDVYVFNRSPSQHPLSSSTTISDNESVLVKGQGSIVQSSCHRNFSFRGGGDLEEYKLGNGEQVYGSRMSPVQKKAYQKVMADIQYSRKKRKWQHVLRLLGEAKSCGLSVNTRLYNECIKSMAEAAKKYNRTLNRWENTVTRQYGDTPWKAAVFILKEMKAGGTVPNVITYNSCITACGRGKQWKTALSLLGEMKANGVVPNVITYNSCITACGHGKQWKAALSLLEEMKANGVVPNVITYNSCITACGGAGQWEAALSLLEEMKANGVVPDVITYSSCIT
ncbi:unnamed protein product, partial [Choristocarpus tenellus]